MKTSSNHFDESSVNLLTRKEEEKDGEIPGFQEAFMSDCVFGRKGRCPRTQVDVNG